MEQKDYKMEIIKELLREPSHARQLARKVSTNHMMVTRSLNALLKNNVLDYRNEGRNKVYFIKKSAESRSYVFMCECYKLVAMLKKYPELRSLIDKLQSDPRIKLAVVFGSFAKLSARPDSDIDVYIETRDSRIKREFEMLDSRLSVKIGNYDRKNLLIKEIEKNHVIIKGIDEFYEKSCILS
jgi:predicted nucleotidyltransferase